MNNKKQDIKEINFCIINSTDVPKSINKNNQFYDYLLNNNVGYYYSKQLSKKSTEIENRILKRGNDFNKKYHKTLNLLCNICNKHKIEFLLFKTYKYISEAVDGDIDIIIKKKDFCKFLEIFNKFGFNCQEDGFLKSSCEKKGYCKIEPRVSVSSHDIVFMSEKDIWKHTEKIRINGINLQKTTKEVDLFGLLLNILFGPNYLKLYLCLVLKQVNQTKILAVCPDPSTKKDLEFLFDRISKINFSKEYFPYFLDNFSLIKFYIKRILFRKHLKFIEKIKYIVFFFYIKYKYLITKKLHFKHKWI